MLQEKNREIEWLRAQKAADDVSIIDMYQISRLTDVLASSANAN